MSVELQIIRASDFVRLGADELLDFDETRKALQLLAQACRKRGLDRAMLDLRALPIPAKPRFTSTELAALVGTFREAGFSRQQRLAILYQQDPHRGARTFAFISRMRGLQVQAFGDFETALYWLWEEPQHAQVERRERGTPIPITIRHTPP